MPLRKTPFGVRWKSGGSSDASARSASPCSCAVAVAPPVDFAAADGMPVDLVFGLVSPETSGVGHLHALAAISRLVRDERVHDALSEAPDAEALYGLLANASDRDAA